MSTHRSISPPRSAPIIIFDGECAFCHRGVQFIINHDPRGVFRFTPRQSPIGQALLAQHHLLENRPDSMILVENERAFIRSDAALHIARHLRAPWRWLSAFLIIPRILRDPFYRLIADNRHRFSRTTTECIVPSPDLLARTLPDE